MVTNPTSNFTSSQIISSVTKSTSSKESDSVQLGPTREAAAAAEALKSSTSLTSSLPTSQVISGVISSTSSSGGTSPISSGTSSISSGTSSSRKRRSSSIGPTREALAAATAASMVEPMPSPTPIRSTNIISNIPREVSSLPSGLNVDLARASLSMPSERFGPGGIFENKFFSVAGQKERIVNAAKTVTSAVLPGGATVSVNRAAIGNEKIARSLEIAASNPFITAFVGAGLFTGGAAIAPSVARGVSTVKSVPLIQGLGRGVSAVKSLPGGKFAFDLVGTGVRGVAITEGVKKVSDITASDIERNISSQPFFDEVIGRGFAAEGAAQPDILRNLAFQINPALSTKKDVFSQTVRKEFEALGVSDVDAAVRAAERRRGATSFGEGLSLLEISRSSEAIGRAGVSEAFAKKAGTTVPASRAFVETFKTTFKPIGRAGIIEGAVGELVQEISREEAISPKKIAVIGGFGGLSAGILGGTIAGFKPTSPGKSAVIETAASIADPFEKPGDLLQDLFEFGAKKAGRSVPSIPVISFAPTETFSFGGSGGKKGKIVNVGDLGFIGTPVPSPTSTPSTTPTLVTSNILSPVPTPVPSPTFVPTPVSLEDILGPTPTPSPVPTPVPSPTSTPTPTDILNLNVSVPIPTLISIPIPTVSPLLRIPPPIPLKFPSGTGGFGTRVGKSRTFLNELSAGLNILGGLNAPIGSNSLAKNIQAEKASIKAAELKIKAAKSDLRIKNKELKKFRDPFNLRRR